MRGQWNDLDAVFRFNYAGPTGKSGGCLPDPEHNCSLTVGYTMLNLVNRWPDYLLPVGIIACLMVIFVPLPPALMDLLLAANISVAVIVLLGTIYVKSPLEFSVFPSLLLATTMARLALNIGTTRLILTRGAIDHEAAAGGVVQSFAEFVTGDNLAVGFVIFSIIVVVQFVVITKGSSRISEVAARFALDGLPGRQMAIDAELNAGTIDHHQAKILRAETIDHADFYGAMDGASKYVRGDAIAGVVITGINIIGGLAIGMSQNMSFGKAAETFTKLTIGDGLVSQLPALLISLAAALLVTRSTRKTDLPRESLYQVFSQPIVLVLTAIFLSLLVLTELPKLPLLMIAAGCLAVAYFLSADAKQKSLTAQADPELPKKPISAEATIEKLLNSEIMEMELGVGLIRLADSRQGGGLLSLVTQIRKDIANEFGLILPKLRIRDNLSLPANGFQILVHGNVMRRGDIDPGSFLAIDRGQATGPLNNGAVTGIPAEGFLDSPAFWIHPDAYEKTLAAGYEVVTAEEVLAAQLKLTAEQNSSQLLSRDATRQLIEEVHKHSPAVVDELIPHLMSLGQVQQVLKSLLDEGVSIRPLGMILETLGDNAKLIENRWDLLEKVRLRLARHITSKLQDAGGGNVIVYTIAEDLQDRIACAWERKQNEIRIGMPRETVQKIALAMEMAAVKMAAAGFRPIVLVNQSIRPVIAELAFESRPRILVVGNREIQGAEIQVLGEISVDQVNAMNNAAA